MKVIGKIFKFTFVGVLLIGNLIANIIGVILCAVTSQN